MRSNENKISDSGARRGSCVRSKARDVTRGAVSCIAWLGVLVGFKEDVEKRILVGANCSGDDKIGMKSVTARRKPLRASMNRLLPAETAAVKSGG